MADEIKKVVTIEMANPASMEQPGKLVAATVASTESMALPGSMVVSPVASADNMTTPGALVTAPVAPSTGNIPVDQHSVVVQVKEWFQSSTIMTSIGLLFLTGLDALWNVLIPILQSPDPIDWNTLPSKLIRPILMAIAVGYMGLRKKNDSSAVR